MIKYRYQREDLKSLFEEEFEGESRVLTHEQQFDELLNFMGEAGFRLHSVDEYEEYDVEYMKSRFCYNALFEKAEDVFTPVPLREK